MLKNARIRTRVAAAFGLVILLAATTIIWLLAEMASIAKSTQELYQKPYAANNDMWTIRRNLIDTERLLSKLVASDADGTSALFASTQKTLVADEANLKTAISSLKSIFTTTESLGLLGEIETIVANAGEARQQVMALVEAGKPEEAYTFMDSSFEPLFQSCNEKVLALFAITENDASNFVTHAQTSSKTAVIAGIFALIVGLLVAAIITTSFAKTITRPLKQLEEAAHQMTLGNLKAVDQVTYQSRNEMGVLADSLRFTMTTLSSYVDEISMVLIRLAQGDLTVPGNEITDFLGDFSEIKQSLVTILKSFNNTLGEISLSAEQVDSGAGQVSNASQLLSQGATEQATAIEELTASVEQISVQVRETADNARSADEFTTQVSQEVSDSNRHMDDMSRAMEEISQSSEQIGKIIKTIEDIAFQTNILALNAAVEAARAGAAGKGFAVVADEVRNLASKSAEASKNTASLIENSARSVQNGAAIAEQTAQSLAVVAKTTKQVVDTVTRIAEASEMQAEAVDQITARVEEISSVVQTNSATAEQSAAASEELSSQANLLNRLVGRFRLYRAAQSGAYSDRSPASRYDG